MSDSSCGTALDSSRLAFLKALPPASRVLELGARDGQLGEAYRQMHSFAEWHSVGDVDPAGRPTCNSATSRDDKFDLICFENLLERAHDPSCLLKSLRRQLAPAGRLVCRIENGNHVSIIEHFLLGDLSCLQEQTDMGRRLFSPASAIKMFLDAGWFPNMADGERAAGRTQIWEMLRVAGGALGSSVDAFDRNILLKEMIFDCTVIEERAVYPQAHVPSVSVVVPVTNPLQFELNIARSPGLREMHAQLVPVYGATSAADGFERGRAEADGDWILYCHQDIYLPEGAGAAVVSELARVEPELARERIIGFVGIADLTDEQLASGAYTRFSGRVIDRIFRLDYQPTPDALSIDESIVIMHRDCIHKIDPLMGWHLWATELVLSAKRRCRTPPCTVVGIPIFHNSLTGWTLVGSFEASKARLFELFPERSEIISLSGTWPRAIPDADDCDR